jgi:hypothetical protein
VARRGGLLGKLSKRFSDPHQVGGSIDVRTWLIDPKRALILERVAVAEVGIEEGDIGEVGIAVEVGGHINTTPEPANLLLLMSPDIAALLVSQIIGLVRDGRTGAEFDHLLAVRMAEALGGKPKPA